MGKSEGLSFSAGGAALAGVAMCANLIYSSELLLPAAGSMVIGGFLLDKLFNDTKMEKLFRMCGLQNNNKEIPLIIKKEKKDKQTTLVLHLPPGLSQRHFEQKQQELEQALNAKIEFGFNKNLIMKVMPAILKSRYDYIFEPCDSSLEVYCGNTNSGKFIFDIEKCPHCIIAGETSSGKSSLLRNMVLSMILNSHNIDLHLIDFQAVELGIFEGCRKVKSYGEKPSDFEKLMDEMTEENEKRLKLFRSVKNKVYIENLKTWNKKFPDKALSHKVVIIDEFARLAESEFEYLLEQFRTRVAMDRKVGIHYIVSMQRPDVKCISGSIKANMPTRIAFKTVTQVDSEVILDKGGAEHIKQPGRFLIKYCGELQEVQALYLENEKVRSFLKKYKAYKTAEEIQLERKEQIKELRKKCINPYLKQVME